MANVPSGEESAKEIQRLEGQLRRSKRGEKTWRDKTVFYEELIHNISDSIFVTDDAGSFTYICPNVHTQFGYAHAEVEKMGNIEHLLGKEIFHPGELKISGEIPNIERTITRKDGGKRTLLVNVKRVSMRASSLLYICRDATVRKETEDVLRASEEKYRALFEGMLNGAAYCKMLFDKDKKPVDWIYLDINRTFETITGLTKEVIGKTVTEAIPGVKEDTPELFEIYGKVASTGETAGFEIYMDTLKVWFSVMAYSLQKDYFVAVFEDITDRKEAEEKTQSLLMAVHHERETLSALFNSMTDEVWFADTNGQFTLANPSALGEFQLGLGDGIDVTTLARGLEVLRPDGSPRPTEEAPPLRALKGEVIVNQEELVRTPATGELRYRQVSASPVRDVDGHVIGSVSVVRDITDSKRMEEHLLRTQKLESVGVLAGGIAHDFNNILTTIIGNISMAKAGVPPGDEIFDLLSEVETASAKAQTLTRELLTFAKGGTPVKETASMGNIVMESSLFVLRGSKSKCVFSMVKDLWPVEADTGQMSQVIHNIIINANQAMPEGGIIDVRAENLVMEETNGLPIKPGKFIRISITDQGIGIAENHLSNIFDPYFTTKQAGSGLGLATTYSIIKKHEGFITVKSRLGVGTTFHIYLPASDKSIPSKEEVRLMTGHGRILVMDDDPSLGKMVGRMLEKLGYESECSEDGTEAIRIYKEAKDAGKPYDAVILDLTVPGGMGGKEAMGKLLELDPEVTAIVSSGYSDDPVLSNFKDYGFKGVMPKPFEFGSLSRVLHEVLKVTHEV